MPATPVTEPPHGAGRLAPMMRISGCGLCLLGLAAALWPRRCRALARLAPFGGGLGADELARADYHHLRRQSFTLQLVEHERRQRICADRTRGSSRRQAPLRPPRLRSAAQTQRCCEAVAAWWPWRLLQTESFRAPLIVSGKLSTSAKLPKLIWWQFWQSVGEATENRPRRTLEVLGERFTVHRLAGIMAALQLRFDHCRSNLDRGTAAFILSVLTRLRGAVSVFACGLRFADVQALSTSGPHRKNA